MQELDAVEVERRGALAGLNPMFGEWQQSFAFEPVSYINEGRTRAEFKRRISEALNTRFVYTGHVTFTVTLYLDEQKLLETPRYGDLDNYAKCLLDSLKGPGTPLIDDCQVQRLDICWIDVPHTPRFEIELRGSPDDFALTPLRLFEMPDGLFYPVSTQAWSAEGPVELQERDVAAMLSATAAMTGAKRQLRHELRSEGTAQFRAFQFGKYVSPSLTGFHRTRVAQSGFELVPLKTWRTL